MRDVENSPHGSTCLAGISCNDHNDKEKGSFDAVQEKLISIPATPRVEVSQAIISSLASS